MRLLPLFLVFLVLGCIETEKTLEELSDEEVVEIGLRHEYLKHYKDWNYTVTYKKIVEKDSPLPIDVHGNWWEEGELVVEVIFEKEGNGKAAVKAWYAINESKEAYKVLVMPLKMMPPPPKPIGTSSYKNFLS
jgi:Mrp family chromosome partitioning ATPase